MCAMQPVQEMTVRDQGLILSLLFGIHFRDFGDLLVTGKCFIDLPLIGSFAISYIQAVLRKASTLPSVSWDFSILLPSSQQQFHPFFISLAEFLTGVFCPSMHQDTLEVPCAPLSIYDMVSYLQCSAAQLVYACWGPLCHWRLMLQTEIGRRLGMGLQDLCV